MRLTLLQLGNLLLLPGICSLVFAGLIITDIRPFEAGGLIAVFSPIRIAGFAAGLAGIWLIRHAIMRRPCCL